MVEHGKVVMASRGGLYPQGFDEMALGFFLLSPVTVYEAEIIMGLILFRVEPQGFVVLLYSFVQLSRPVIGPSEIVPHPLLGRAFAHGVFKERDLIFPDAVPRVRRNRERKDPDYAGRRQNPSSVGGP